MIERVQCDSLSCIHNQNGACASGAIDVQYYAGPGYGDAYCNSYARAGSLRSQVSEQMPSAATAVNMQAHHAGMSEQNTVVLSDFISCAATDCIYNRLSRCDAQQVRVSEPEHNGTLSLCKTYTK
ncbi:MAG: hypothetical protein DBY39_03545 [Clostridiales bacterium]|nr:MAG: hypothetical protein DBY39_03545 [Clostridiales bacterium]